MRRHHGAFLSGVGKSSLVRAGVVASLVRADTPVLVGRPGAHPLESLAGVKPRGRQTLVVDQAEEAVTLCVDPVERERYFTALATHVGAGGGLVLTLRADHLGDLAPYPEIARILEDGLYLLGPMREPDLRRAIEAPARGAGLRLEPGLVDLAVREADGEPAGLPMLSHVLRETWERREGSTLTVDGYKATGGIQHAVSQSAELLYDAMDEPQRAQLRSLLLRLVVPTEAGEPVRTRVPRDKVAVEDHARLVEQLVDACLVSIDGDAVQIAHEALVRVWPRLRGWLDDDIEGQRLFRHLAEAADAWHAMGRPGQRAVPGGAPDPGAGLARPGPAGPQRHRVGLPRCLGGPVRLGAPRLPAAGPARAPDQPPAAGRPGRCRRACGRCSRGGRARGAQLGPRGG